MFDDNREIFQFKLNTKSVLMYIQAYVYKCICTDMRIICISSHL